jgi:hypothetical protein
MLWQSIQVGPQTASHEPAVNSFTSSAKTANEGLIDGIEVVGENVGLVGSLEGVRDGNTVGTLVGDTVGRQLGILEGETDGSLEGDTVGRKVGEVGALDGDLEVVAVTRNTDMAIKIRKRNIHIFRNPSVKVVNFSFLFFCIKFRADQSLPCSVLIC